MKLSDGYSVVNEENCTIYNFDNKDNAGSICIHRPFKGVYISFNTIQGEFLPNLIHSFHAEDMRHHFIINYCKKGRCEVSLKDNVFVYQKTGDFSVANEFSQNGFYFPQKRYVGIEMSIDLEEASDIFVFLEQNFNINVQRAITQLIGDNHVFIARCNAKLETLFDKMWHCQKDENSILNLRLYIIEMFYLLERSEFIDNSYTYLSATQKEIARNTEKIITEDLSRHFSAKSLAEKFKISESSLKNYFKGVYGQNISFYLKDLRLDVAAEMLMQSKLSVNEIANTVGYSNQSKFSAVFKKRFLVNPLEYRKQKALEKNVNSILK